MKPLMRTAFALTLLSTPAFAKGGTPQNHHCMKDGAELAGKTRKQCKADGGKWDKMEAAKAEAKPGEAKPAEAKPAAAKPMDAKPAEAKPAPAKPAEAKPAPAK